MHIDPAKIIPLLTNRNHELEALAAARLIQAEHADMLAIALAQKEAELAQNKSLLRAAQQLLVDSEHRSQGNLDADL